MTFLKNLNARRIEAGKEKREQNDSWQIIIKIQKKKETKGIARIMKAEHAQLGNNLVTLPE